MDRTTPESTCHNEGKGKKRKGPPDLLHFGQAKLGEGRKGGEKGGGGRRGMKEKNRDPTPVEFSVIEGGKRGKKRISFGG